MNKLYNLEKEKKAGMGGKLVLDENSIDNLRVTKIYQKPSFQKIEEDLKQVSSVNQKLHLHSLQRHLSLIKLEEFLLIITFITAGVLGRILLQPLPSVEPITFFVVLAGSLFGWKKGAVTGATTWYLSDFFMLGGQGPWTIVYLANGAIAGFLGGVFLQKPRYTKTIIVMIIATIIFQISIDIMSGLLFYGILASFITAIPFAITHIISNIAFSFFVPKTRKEIYEKGRLNEKELCKKFIEKIKSLKSKNES